MPLHVQAINRRDVALRIERVRPDNSDMGYSAQYAGLQRTGTELLD
jgi:hypothetical protein